MRGEQSAFVIVCRDGLGSSPHARGADARSGECRTGCSDHPRMRGEQFLRLLGVGRRKGSSPHARGAVNALKELKSKGRIIPACAGSSRPFRVLCGCAWDHPRMRGEQAYFMLCGRFARGSSPHARGAERRVDQLADDARIIPACAGSRISMIPPNTVRRDHPRMRGEQWSCSMSGADGLGSSPHARGAGSSLQSTG